jgi:hypothetical protein
MFTSLLAALQTKAGRAAAASGRKRPISGNQPNPQEAYEIYGFSLTGHRQGLPSSDPDIATLYRYGTGNPWLKYCTCLTAW